MKPVKVFNKITKDEKVVIKLKLFEDGQVSMTKTYWDKTAKSQIPGRDDGWLISQNLMDIDRATLTVEEDILCIDAIEEMTKYLKDSELGRKLIQTLQ